MKFQLKFKLFHGRKRIKFNIMLHHMQLFYMLLLLHEEAQFQSYHYSNIKWASRHLNLPASQLFVLLLVQADIKGYIKLCITGPLWGKSNYCWQHILYLAAFLTFFRYRFDLIINFDLSLILYLTSHKMHNPGDYWWSYMTGIPYFYWNLQFIIFKWHLSLKWYKVTRTEWQGSNIVVPVMATSWYVPSANETQWFLESTILGPVSI